MRLGDFRPLAWVVLGIIVFMALVYVITASARSPVGM